jgi:hypothetical protein
LTIGSPGELLTALARKQYDAILGTPEGNNLDFKEHPYRLHEERGKWELCKDVAALSNTSGGCLVIGYSVRRGPTDVAEVADELHPVPVDLINPDQYKKVLSSGVYPPPRVALHAFTDSLPEGHQIFVVEVSNDKMREPFLVRRMPATDGKVSSEAVGVPSRFHDDTIWESAEEIHQRIRGLVSVETSPPGAKSPARTESLVDGTHVEKRLAGFQVRSDEQLRHIAHLQEWMTEPVYSLHAIPVESGYELHDLHDPSGLGGVLQRPPSLRPTGFGLATGTSEVIDGALVGRSDRGPVVWLDADGFFTAAVQGTREYLGWAVNDGILPSRPWTLINSLVLVEFTLEFFRLVHSALVPRIRGPWLFGVRCRGFLSGQLRLAPDFHTKVLGLFDENTNRASSDDWWRSFIDQNESLPGMNALGALRSVYQLFGLPPSVIPFTEESEVSEEAIRQA